MSNIIQSKDHHTFVLAANIVSAYVEHNTIASGELPKLIASVHATLAELATQAPAEPPAKPAVSFRGAIKPDSIACFECGRRFRSLKRHLTANHHLTPEMYRKKWDLRPDFPMAAPNYSAQRSELAKKLGLGHRRWKS